jgi:CDGSH-type Zn-finger protein
MSPVESNTSEPIEINVTAGKTYLWCSCGRTNRQPFCDSSHAGSGRGPLRYRATGTGPAYFCGCKLTKTPPLCDGSHGAA